jgi:hypothetical protein
MTSLIRLGTGALLLLTALACDPSDACDPGEYEEHGLCRSLPEPADAGGDAGSGDDEDAGSEADAAPPSDPYEGFGD